MRGERGRSLRRQFCHVRVTLAIQIVAACTVPAAGNVRPQHILLRGGVVDSLAPKVSAFRKPLKCS